MEPKEREQEKIFLKKPSLRFFPNKTWLKVTIALGALVVIIGTSFYYYLRMRTVVVVPGTNLMWTRKDNGEDVDRHEADKYCKDLSLEGYTDWRLPTLDELERLYDPNVSGTDKISKPFELTACCPWSSTKEGLDSAWYFHFLLGWRAHDFVGYSSGRRALCVRRSGE